jgi:hypothetical protein
MELSSFRHLINKQTNKQTNKFRIKGKVTFNFSG